MMLTHHGAHGKLKLFHLEDGGFNHQRDYKTTCHETGEEISITFDFTQKQGVIYSKIFVPEGFEDAAWLQDREQLWNGAEAREKERILGLHQK